MPPPPTLALPIMRSSSLLDKLRKVTLTALLRESDRADWIRRGVEAEHARSQHQWESKKSQQELAIQNRYKDLIHGLETKVERAEVQAKLVQQELITARGRLQQRRQEMHPLCGEMLMELGNRKVFATNPKKLVNQELFPTYKAQRTFRKDRADAMAEAMKKDTAFNGFPGVISMYEFVGEESAARRGHHVRGIVDGQHRVRAIESLLKSGDWPEDRPVITEVFYVSDPAEAAKLFLQINKSEPVLDIDLATVVKEAATGKNGKVDEFIVAEVMVVENLEVIKESIDTVASSFSKKFPDMFKVSTRCKQPHVNIDVMRQRMFESEDCKREAAKGTEALMKFVHSRNYALKARVFPESSAVNKARLHDFFLGLEPNWCGDKGN